ncbi:hypothetical protein H6800_02490 [Candidatus Nomurabacteria bacterium]|nr:hypothetical protein [Candidatus Nomurabacteria bacterium]
METALATRRLIYGSWGLAAVVCGLAIFTWQGVRFDGRSLSIYDWFPLLGLLAFSLMWTHYILGSVRRYIGLPKDANQNYNSISGAVVLLLILLHPSLLIFALYKDGFGLPPSSYLTVYGEPIMKVAIILGTTSFIIFMMFELKRWLQDKPIWRVIDSLQAVAMGFIFYHALTLGGELSTGWYKTVWYFYGISLLVSLILNYKIDKKTGESNAIKQK